MRRTGDTGTHWHSEYYGVNTHGPIGRGIGEQSGGYLEAPVIVHTHTHTHTHARTHAHSQLILLCDQFECGYLYSYVYPVALTLMEDRVAEVRNTSSQLVGGAQIA